MPTTGTFSPVEGIARSISGSEAPVPQGIGNANALRPVTLKNAPAPRPSLIASRRERESRIVSWVGVETGPASIDCTHAPKATFRGVVEGVLRRAVSARV